MSKLIIGIDIGGTNTDSVLVDSSNKIIKSYKTKTTHPIEEGVFLNLNKLLDGSENNKSKISGLFIGTTHATNAIVEEKGLNRVGLLRIAGHKPLSLRPCFSWPKSLKEKVFVGFETINGGFECDLRPITRFSLKEAKNAISKLLDKGMECLAINGVFSPLLNSQELLCYEALKEIAGADFPVSFSHEIGGIGFIERENGTLLNGALKKAMSEGFSSLEKVREKIGLSCPLYITQNDGSLIDLKEAIRNPLLTISSGPTNSFIGATKLAEIKDAIVVDVGGTTTDVGLVQNGFLRRSIHHAKVGGVTLNFRTPDLLSIGIGGGSLVKEIENGFFRIGPESVGKNLFKESFTFGGKTLTLTDIATKLSLFDLKPIQEIPIESCKATMILKEISQKIQNGILLMRGKFKELPLIYVGGGARIAASSNENLLEHYAVANAYGAALAEFSGTVDRVVSLTEREKVLGQLKEEAITLAVQKGADKKKTKIVDIQQIPYHYMPNSLARVIITAFGRGS